MKINVNSLVNNSLHSTRIFSQRDLRHNIYLRMQNALLGIDKEKQSLLIAACRWNMPSKCERISRFRVCRVLHIGRMYARVYFLIKAR